MNWNQACGGCVFGWIIFLSGCNGSRMAEEGRAGRKFDGLDVTIEQSDRFGGEHVLGGARIVFDAQSPSVDLTLSTLVVNDKVFEWQWDDERGVFSIDGHDNALTEEESAALDDLRGQVESRYTEGSSEDDFDGFPRHVGLLLGQIGWLQQNAEAAPLGRHARTFPLGQPDSASDARERGYYYGTDLEFYWPQLRWLPACARKGTWRTAYICPNGNCNQTRYALVNGTGGTTISCGGSNKWNLGRNTCGDWTCQGQCGVGCQAWWHDGAYVDCFEHDVCTDWYVDAACNLDKAFAAWAFSDSYVNWYRCR